MSLSTMRDLLIVIGIYLYFIAWVYLHAYYESFGISTESLRLDYSSYMVFSYNVITSAAFVSFASWVMAAVLALWAGLVWLEKKGLRLLRRMHMKFGTWVGDCITLVKTIKPIIVGLAMVLLFPILFGMARDTALTNYAKDRTNTGERHRIQFVFREDAGFAKKVPLPDAIATAVKIAGADTKTTVATGIAATTGTAAVMTPAAPGDYDLQLLNTDNGKTLRFLGETDQYFIVLHQAQDPGSAQLPQGAIYYIDKKDVLLSHIILSSR